MRDEAEDFFNKGVVAFKENNLKEALYYYKKTINLNPNHFKAWRNLGSLLEKQKEFDNDVQLKIVNPKVFNYYHSPPFRRIT